METRVSTFISVIGYDLRSMLSIIYINLKLEGKHKTKIQQEEKKRRNATNIKNNHKLVVNVTSAFYFIFFFFFF